MTMPRLSLPFLGLILLAPAAAPAEPLTLAQCVAIALKENPEIESASFEVEAANAVRKKTVGSYGPRLKLDAGFQVWNQALPFDLGSFSETMGWYGNSIGTLAQNTSTELPPAPVAAAMPNIRDRVTWSAGLTFAQPLGALWTVHEGYTLTKLGVDVAYIQQQVTQRNVTFQVTEAYYRLMQAERMADVAAKSVEQVDAQVRRARTFFERGAVARNDVLRAELGLAAAQLRLIQAKGNVLLARGRLATLLGRAPGLEIETVDDGRDPTGAPLPSPADAEARAVQYRVELKEVAARTEQARTAVRLAKSKMLPQINLVGSYTHSAGQAFAPSDSAFVGAMASWDIWEGGGTYYAIDEAKARVAQALSARRKAEDMIRLDVRSAHVGVTTAAEALEVAKYAVEQAEENFRIEQKRYESTSNTSFDVLDAETQLTTARGQHQAALYDYVIARSNLARAMGATRPSPMAAQ
jgi:outer membrane protein TolC